MTTSLFAQPPRTVWGMRAVAVIALVACIIVLHTVTTRNLALYGQVAVIAGFLVFLTAMFTNQHTASRLLFYVSAGVVILVTVNHHWTAVLALIIAVVGCVIPPRVTHHPPPEVRILNNITALAILALVCFIAFGVLVIDVILLLTGIWFVWTLCAYTWPRGAYVALNLVALLWIPTWIIAIDIILSRTDAIFIQALTVPIGSVIALAVMGHLYRDQKRTTAASAT